MLSLDNINEGRGTYMQISTKFLRFELDADGGNAGFIQDGQEAGAVRGSDFWRLILDDGLRTEIPVRSSKQRGKVTMEGGALTVHYDKLVSDYGDSYAISFTVTVKEEDGLLRFAPTLQNNTADVRINECFCPLCDFETLGGDKAKDALYLPNGLGRRIENPWTHLESLTGNYYAHDTTEIFIHLHYPRASMGWFGIESGNRFLYVARYDPEMRHCFMTVRQRIHHTPLDLMVGFDHFPMAHPGERLTLPPVVVGLLDGDWRCAARRYRAWADANFFRIQPKADWVQNLTGWQRIILRSQYGEDYYTARDLPRLYEEGAKYGIHTLFLFAWWREGMDRAYPIYKEPYAGAFDELKKNIQKVQDMGGRVILECNCHFLDPQGDYYRQYGDEVKILDINGNEVRPAFVYPGMGEFRAAYGAKQFPLCCAGTVRWREQLMAQMRQLRSLEADCLFADCYGGTPYQPCFNHRHEHGLRVDEEWISHRKFFDEAVAYCKEENRVFAAEVVTDIAAAYTQFIHGLVNVDFKVGSDAFPALFRYTFPKVITTTRGVRHEEGDFARQLRCALVSGVRIDAELYVCRADLSTSPKYAAEVKRYTDTQTAYAEYLLRGKFTVLDASPLPYYIKRGEFYSEDGTKVLRILYNAAKETTETVCGVSLRPDEMRFDIYDRESYEKEMNL